MKFHRIHVSAFAMMAILADAAVAQQKAPEPTNDDVAARLAVVRENLSKNLDLRQLLAKEEADWKLGKEILADRVKFLRDQLADLAAKKFDEQGKIGEADKEKDKLVKNAEGLSAADEVARTRVRELESRLRRLLPVLPPPLTAKVAPLAERMPKADLKEEDIRMSVAQRYANVLGIANEINKFQGDIVSNPERRTLSNGSEAEVQTLYVGLGQGFYAGDNETAGEAGRGTASLDGWKWKATPENAADLGQVLKLHGGAGMAKFFDLVIETDKAVKSGSGQ